MSQEVSQLPRAEGGMGEVNVHDWLQRSAAKTATRWSDGRSAVHMAIGQILASPSEVNSMGATRFIEPDRTGRQSRWCTAHWKRGISALQASATIDRGADGRKGIATLLRLLRSSDLPGRWSGSWWTRYYTPWIPEIRTLRYMHKTDRRICLRKWVPFVGLTESAMPVCASTDSSRPAVRTQFRGARHLRDVVEWLFVA